VNFSGVSVLLYLLSVEILSPFLKIILQALLLYLIELLHSGFCDRSYLQRFRRAQIIPFISDYTLEGAPLRFKGILLLLQLFLRVNRHLQVHNSFFGGGFPEEGI